jgi:hypothetical protein
MPASDNADGRGVRIQAVLCWSGIGLAPLAALLLLLGRGDIALRVGGALAVGSIVLIGLSIVLRRDRGGIRADLEDLVYYEIDGAREQARNDIATAARATHKAFGEKALALQETINELRGQVRALQAQLERAGGPAVGPGPVQHAPAHSVPGSHRVGAHAGGVVRHTETVVTTRQTTLVDPNESMEGRGRVYGRSHPEPARRHDWSGPPTRPADWSGPPSRADWSGSAPRQPEPAEESWTEKLLRERFAGRGGQAFDGSGTDRGGETSDRWASVRSDDRGRELRMGERRAALHADESGTEFRMEDRWASVRREDRHEDAREPLPRRDGRWSGDWDRRQQRDPAQDWERSHEWDRGGSHWSGEYSAIEGRPRHSRD